MITPFAEKEIAKALGARWDGARRIWYVVDIEDLAPFKRWIPDFQASADSSSSSKQRLPTPSALTEQILSIANCGCDVLPWDDCIHTKRT